MIDKKDLKVGDKVAGIYSEGYAGSGKVVPMVIKKITKKHIVAATDVGEYKFINDDEMSYESLVYSHHQHFHLFLGTVEEAKKYDEEREIQENFYSQNQELILSKLPHLPLEALKEIVDIIKKH